MDQNQEQQQESNKQEESLKDHPVIKLYDHIYKANADLFDQPDMKTAYADIERVLGHDVSIKLMAILVNALTNSACTAIALYDELLQIEINSHLDSIIKAINADRADIDGIKGAVKVFRQRIDELQKKIVVDGISAATGSSVTG